MQYPSISYRLRRLEDCFIFQDFTRSGFGHKKAWWTRVDVTIRFRTPAFVYMIYWQNQVLLVFLCSKVTQHFSFCFKVSLSEFFVGFGNSGPHDASATQRDREKARFCVNRVLQAVMRICAMLGSADTRSRELFSNGLKETSHRVVIFHVCVWDTFI